MSQNKKNNIIIGSLCGILLLMVIGYAAFSSVLKINGTTGISSDWDVKITNIQEGIKIGSAATVLKENGEADMSYENLSATFKTNLASPGDSIEYIITVTNNGTFDAKLDSITLSDLDNEYIIFETSGLKENDTLEKNTSKTLTVKVTFKDVTINKMNPSTSSLTVTLDFSQDGGNGTVTPTPQLKTVYAYHTDIKTIGTSKLTESEYKTNYTELETYQTGRAWFLKYDLDAAGIIQNAYACMKYAFIDEPVCMQGGSTDYYASNKSILEGLQTTFVENAGSCSLGDSPSDCSVGYLRVRASSTGGVNTRDTNTNISCGVNSEGNVNCYA